ncbi:UNVERIFIED_CONTAM: hypothetical protein Sradi_5289000 [Sesamum radiatum]|uniref:CCHC-type domain-containing protein n=1 Tax=Sesamum radiatum TaxID=300843 RepID=A0AAW2LPM9_SESRA
MRIRVALDIRKPILRFLHVSSESVEQSTVSFSYERLSLFCYICGMVGHIAQNCEKQYEDGYVDSGEEKQYGPWLSAAVNRRPPRRFAGDSRQAVRPPLGNLSELLRMKRGNESRRGMSIFESIDATRDYVLHEFRRVEEGQGVSNGQASSRKEGIDYVISHQAVGSKLRSQ